MKPTRRLLILASSMALVACGGKSCGGLQPPSGPAQKAIPVACKEETPARPVFAMKQLPKGVPLDTFVQAAIVDEKRRDGYEEQLETALANCKKPIE